MITLEFDNPSLPHYNSAMNTPFPGMDPYLEHPILWADVHDTAPTNAASCCGRREMGADLVGDITWFDKLTNHPIPNHSWP